MARRRLLRGLLVEMGIEPNQNRTNRTRTLILEEPNRTRTRQTKKYVEPEPNRTHEQEEPEPNWNFAAWVLLGSCVSLLTERRCRRSTGNLEKLVFLKYNMK